VSRFPLRVERVRAPRLFAAGILIALGVCMPYMLNVRSFGISRGLSAALAGGDEGGVLLVALKLVLLNALRALPHYLGAFLMSEALRFSWRGRRTSIPNMAIIAGAIVLTYRAIYIVHGILYDFGAPAIVVIGELILLRALDYDLGGSWKKPVMLGAFLAAFQLLDVIPLLGALPFGRGETSQDVKLAATVLGADGLLNAVGLLLFAIMLGLVIPLFMLARDENNLREMHALREQNQRIHTQKMLGEVENRTYAEMRHLVHDLKSPLTSMQALVGILKLESEGEGRAQDAEYLGRIENGIERMSSMISELLSADTRAEVCSGELLSTALAQVSELDCAERIAVDDRARDAVVYVNRVLIARALVNLISNAANAIEGRADGRILVSVERVDEGEGPTVRFEVSDNGVGIPEADLARIWDSGFTTHGSTGLGMGFVKSAVERSDGAVSIVSRPGSGSRVIFQIPEEVRDEKADDDTLD